MLKTKEEIIDWLEKYNVKNYTINEDLSVNSSTTVDISGLDLIHIPVKFNFIQGDFYCSSNMLCSLDGCPDYVSGNFCCNNNALINLKNSPKFVGKNMIILIII